MQLELDLSEKAARWLDLKARDSGTDRADVAARMLEQLAEQDLETHVQAREARLKFFRQWMAGLKARPGPDVDASRDSIYD